MGLTVYPTFDSYFCENVETNNLPTTVRKNSLNLIHEQTAMNHCPNHSHPQVTMVNVEMEESEPMLDFSNLMDMY